MRAKTHETRTQNGGGGSFSDREWFTLCARFEWRCVACGDESRVTPDHVIPVSQNGSSDIGNIQPLCSVCNLRKRDTIRDFRTNPFVEWANLPKTESARDSGVIRFRVTSEERNRVQLMADEARLTVSDFIRSKIGL